jgi:hypothetical protein
VQSPGNGRRAAEAVDSDRNDSAIARGPRPQLLGWQLHPAAVALGRLWTAALALRSCRCGDDNESMRCTPDSPRMLPSASPPVRAAAS